VTLKPPDVVGAEQACELLNISRARFYQLTARPGFPPGTPARGTVYDAVQIRALALGRELDQPVLEALDAYQEHGIAWAAYTADVDPSTIRRWLRRIGAALPAA
jgi:hypothetical protein